MKNVTFRQTLTRRMNSLLSWAPVGAKNDFFIKPAVLVKEVHVNDSVIVIFARTALVEYWHGHLDKHCKMIYDIDIHSMSLLIPTVCIFFWRREDSLLFGKVSILRNSSHEGYFLTLFCTPWIFTQSPFSTIFLMWLYTETMCATGFLHTKKERTLSLFESVLRCFIKAALSLIELCAFSKAFLFFCM